MNVLDLFSGIGCFSLGLERAGMRTIAFCEIEPFPRAVLEKHWPDVPCYGDIRTFRPFSADVVCGGFPCQPFSTASRGRRVAIDLWPEMLRVVECAKPAYVIGENVQEEAIANAARDLDGIGYGTYYRRISGSDAGADHKRDRWWVIAYPNAKSELRRAIDAEVAKLPALCAGLWGAGNYARAVRVLDGPADRMDRIGAIGNAVLPQIPEAIGRAIMNCCHVPSCHDCGYREPCDDKCPNASTLSSHHQQGE
jgi:DNA (cytosine-5)-methyltransferase 1